MTEPRLLAGLALLLVGGCIEFEHAPTTATGDDSAGSTTEAEEPPPLVQCDPLAQDCPDGQACTLASGGFACVDVAVDGAAGDACLAASECGPGLACVQSPALAGCDAASCCSPLCEVGDAGAQCGSAEEECGPVLTGDNVPPEWADYGVCRLPS